MTKVGILGDVHGTANAVLRAVNWFEKQGITTIYQLGDFGFWPGKHGSVFLAFVNTLMSKKGMTMIVTPGNHEDYTQINSWHVHEDGWMRAREHILVAPRGHRWEQDGRSFVSLGGAPSVDREWRIRSQRQQGYPVWWKEEDITAEDMMNTVKGGHADIMLAHDAPYGVPMVEKGIAGNPNGFTPADLEYGLAGRQKMAQVVDIVRPDLFFHGHYHFKVENTLTIFNENTGLEDKTKVFGLAADGTVWGFGQLDLDTMDFRFWGPGQPGYP